MMSALPTDVIPTILSRLPLKSLLRFRCVSKPWYFLIKHPYFIKLHLDHVNQTNLVNIMLQYSYLYSIKPNSNSMYEVKEIDYPYKNPLFSVQIIGSCNGLLCICPDEDVYCIWNPTTQEFKKLPGTPTEYVGTVMDCYGFGYDDSANDYKVVRVSTMYNSPKLNSVQVYNLGTNSWRRVEGVPCDCYLLLDRISGVLVNGCLHWAARSDPEVTLTKKILSFNLRDDRFKVVPLPDYEDDGFCVSVGVFEGSLCVLSDLPRVNRLEVWVMNYGVKESWIKLFSFSERFEACYYFKPSCKALLEMDINDMDFSNLNDESIKTFDNGDIWKWYPSVTYVQTLVSLNSGTYLLEKEAKGIKRKRK